MKEKKVQIASIYNPDDCRLTKKVEIPCAYIDKKGLRRIKNVKVTEAEKYLVECIAMRLFIEHKNIIRKEKLSDTATRLVASIAVDSIR